ncbi:tetratricopeptide repeat protein [Pseudoxanthomonas composti]|uniref:Tetratricopeptide repeat protein n=1 Tax=Pseudoxanthomonas composti TaxID=2137479 RepID=A0A4Q1JYA1_9GAMM|nr:tetratricopeptide repeat protein [Pseudoxanthomonas composti]RXR08294.1 tetratricopeptide repeat protein [Pseudoxanthomonas composti]
MQTSDQAGPTASPRRELRFRFGDCVVDGRSLVLSVGGEAVKLEKKPLEVLLYLLEHAGEVVTKQELLDEVWSGRILSESVLTKTMARLRQALSDEAQALIRTVHGFGYRLVAPVQVEAGPATALPRLPELAVGDAPPLRPLWRLQRRLGSGAVGEAWLGVHTKTGEPRVFKFGVDAGSLTSLKREITLSRVLHEGLGPRQDLVRLLDWNLEEAPFYLETEYVAGRALPDWAEARGGLAQLALSLRLELLAQVADALSAAHSVGVLHKDLKPSNVLVDDRPGAEPRIRLADFGSGRLVDLARLEALEITRLGFTGTQIDADSGGTPLYLAPEILGGRAPTVRSDIYALGVMLYQCLVGDTRRPLAPGWERDIDDPLLREDIALAAAGDPAERLADAALLSNRLRTLESRRATRAAEDAARVEADRLRASLTRTRLRRRQFAIASATLAVVLCVVGVALLQVREAQQRARHEADVAGAVNRFLTEDLLAQANPLVSGRSDVQVRDLLDSAADSVGERFANQPATEASVRMALGNAYLNLGEFGKARAQLDGALRLSEREGGEERIATSARMDLAKLLTRSGDHAASRAMLAPLLGHANPQVQARAGMETAFAQMHEGDLDGALARLQALVPRASTLFGEGASETLTATVYQASALRELGRYDEAIALYRKALAGREALHGKGHIATLEAMRGLGGALFLKEAHAQALPVLRAAHTLSSDIYGPRHDHTLSIASDLALVMQALKDYAGAEKLMLATLEARGTDYGQASGEYRSLLNNLGVLYGETGDLQRQYEYLQRSCQAEHAASGASHPNTLICDHNLARALVDLARYPEAEALERRTLERALPVFGAEHMLMGVAGYTYAGILGHLGRSTESEARFAEAIALLDRALGPGNERSAKAIALRDALRADRAVPVVAAQGRLGSSQR